MIRDLSASFKVGERVSGRKGNRNSTKEGEAREGENDGRGREQTKAPALASNLSRAMARSKRVRAHARPARPRYDRAVTVYYGGLAEGG